MALNQRDGEWLITGDDLTEGTNSFSLKLKTKNKVNDKDIQIEIEKGKTNSIQTTSGDGTVSSVGNNVTLTYSDTQPAAAPYITSNGSGSGNASYTISKGYYKTNQTVNSSLSSNNSNKYYTVDGVNLVAGGSTFQINDGISIFNWEVDADGNSYIY